jgi:hypothetical protein
MKINTLFVIAFCVLLVHKAMGQDNERRNALALQMGFQNGYVKDLNFSPLNYRANGFAAKLDYTRYLGQKHMAFFSVGYVGTTLSTDASESFDTDGYTPTVELGFARKMIEGGKLDWWLGSSVGTFASLAFYDGSESLTYSALHSFNLINQVQVPINDRFGFCTRVNLPLFGLLVRPPYTGWDKFTIENEDSPAKILYRGDWGFWGSFAAFSWENKFQYELSDRFKVMASYRLGYFQADQLDQAIIASHQFTLGTQFSF